MSKFILFTDGGARGNPGHAGIGVVVKDENGELIIEHSGYIGYATNNEAEYTALMKGLDMARNAAVRISNDLPEIVCYLDSELIVKQLNGLYKVKNKRLFELFNNVQEQLKSFSKATFVHVPRSKNERADELVNLALDKHLGL